MTDSYLKFIRSFLLHIYPIFKRGVGTLEPFGCYPLKDGQKPPRLTKDSFLERMCEQCHGPGLHSELLSFESLKRKTFCSLLVKIQGGKKVCPWSPGAIVGLWIFVT